MEKRSRKSEITLQGVLLCANNIVTRSATAIVRDLCTKPRGATATERKIARICRKIDRTNNRIAILRNALETPNPSERAIKLLRLLEAGCQKEIDRTARSRKEFYEPMQAEYTAVKVQLEGLQPGNSDTYAVLRAGMEYAERGAANCDVHIASLNGMAHDASFLRLRAESAIPEFYRAKFKEAVDTHSLSDEALATLEFAASEVQDEVRELATRVRDLNDELEDFNKPLIKMLLAADQPTRTEIGKLLFPEDFSETA